MLPPHNVKAVYAADFVNGSLLDGGIDLLRVY